MLLPMLALALGASAPGDAPITPAEQAAVARASERGALIYAYDQAAWHGTDDMFAKLADAADAAEKIGGYVVDGPADAPRLVFFDKARTKAVYVARFERGRLIEGKVLGPGDDASLSPLDLRMIAALTLARTALAADKTVFTCADKPFNTVVLPPPTPDGPVAVYFLTPQTSNDAIPFGGHFEVDVDVAGHAGPVRRFSNACLAAPTHPKLPKGGKATFFAITHQLDPTPTEVHVFSSLAMHLSVLVATPGPPARIWPVEGTRIGAPVMLKR